MSTGGADGTTLTTLLQSWADGTASVPAVLELRADDETGTNGAKTFSSAEGAVPPSLSMTYDSAPAVPSALSTDQTNEYQPILHATYSDPEEEPGTVEYTVTDTSESGALLTVYTSQEVSSGEDIGTSLLSDLVDGHTYSWVARSFDGYSYSQYSTAQSFLYNPSVERAPNERAGDSWEAFDAAMQDQLGTRYGGTWILPDGTLEAGAVGPTTADSGAAAALSPPGLPTADVVPVDFTQDQLADFQQQVIGIIESQSPPNPGAPLPAGYVHRVYIAPTRNQIVVEAAPGADSEALLNVESTVPTSALSIARTDIGLAGGTEPTTARDTYPPYYGGAKIRNTSHHLYVQFCSSGFDVIKASNSKDYGLVAGHCALNGYAQSMGPSYSKGVGTISLDTFPFSGVETTTDAAIFQLTNQADKSNVIIAGSINRSTIATRTVGVGDTACVSGVTSGAKCATVYTTSDFSLIIGNRPDSGVEHELEYFGFACAGLINAPGDSGGPVYTRVNETPPYKDKAVGLIAYTPNQYFIDTCWDKIANVQSLTGTTVRTSP